ncbi:PTS sugar transporter subunit IIB [Maledivibacter halophilus]|uniref:PTS system, cellobiose-specific IIB component n=1 Tax=Maledivibacter halophilus TaxID=36842 RepID=A0A1T5K027_9FIRM|nr:PTS sugar transporter subunit IIB [Maledivibacter halophilus]SKC56954.1 PTS system, cellobiose-specific IIB component [Maledivibacter halophilus]
MKAVLVCFAGMSTSIMMNKMKKAAAKKDVDLDIKAIPLSELEENLEGVEVVLLGPQIRYAYPEVEKLTEGKIPAVVISSVDYGMMNGEKVLNEAIKAIE